jgi:hypothetical protein
MSERNLGRYADLLEGLRVAAGERGHLGDLLDEIEAWMVEEESACYRVAVFTGRVRGPLTFEAVKRTHRRREGRVTRLLPEKERRARRLSVDAPVVAVVATARDEQDHRQRRYAMFRRPE